MKRIVNALGELNWGKRAYAVFVLCATTATALPAQTFTTLFSFDGTDGAEPYAGLVQATNGDFYGTTAGGGANCASYGGCGTVFKITRSGTLTTLYSFCSQGSFPACTDGGGPSAGLVQATNGDFYGTTQQGGYANCPPYPGCGTVFKITPSGTLTTLYSFCSQSGCLDGAVPYAGLIQAANGDFYGTTQQGGYANCPSYYGCGTIFKITPSGVLTTLYSFCPQSGCTDGYRPWAGLVQATNGDFYGTTLDGGANCASYGGCGTVFKITPSGTLTTLYSLCSQGGFPVCTDGGNPFAGLVQATNGDLYGTTSGAGDGYGTVFKITPGGTLTTLYSFCSQTNCTDGAYPVAGLIQATNGDFYGTASGGGYGGPSGLGTIFKITPSGNLTTLHRFCANDGCPAGGFPGAGLVQDTNGTFYGTTPTGPIATNRFGGIFSLSVGLGPFVETRPTSGKVGRVVEILGTNLTGAASVTFDGTAAVFTVVSPSLITATVPAGATSGKVHVVTPGGTLLSNIAFRVRP
jgi:uncharacterized repeat protein (TIGR03803 family)